MADIRACELSESGLGCQIIWKYLINDGGGCEDFWTGKHNDQNAI